LRFVRYVLMLCFVFLALLPAMAQDQSSITGGLNGVVSDPTGAAVPGANVTISGPQGTVKATTDKAGRFSVTKLVPGYYDVKVEKSGFSSVEAKHSEVNVSTSATLNLTLSVGAAAETVEVSTGTVSIDTQSTAIATNLTDTFYNSIPMQRNVSAIFYVAPGVAAGQVNASPNAIGPGASNPSIGGASGLENLYVVDGVTITDQAFGSIGTYNRYHGSLGTGINLAFVKEVDVKTTAFEPVYGKALGGIVLINTKSGGSSYHGAISAYFAPSPFYASRYQYYQFGYKLTTPSSTLAQPAFDAAAEFGGYIPGFKDKMFFFGAWDPSLTQTYVTANPTAPAASVALGTIHSSITGASYAGKLTYRINDRINFEAAAFGDPSRHNVVPNNLSSPAPITTESSYNFGSADELARLDASLTNSWTVDLAYTYNHNHFNEYPGGGLYEIINTTAQYLPSPGASVTTGLGAYEPSKNNTYSIEANTTKIARLGGQHTFSVGYAYDHTNFLDEPARSGALFPIPTNNYQNVNLQSLFSVIPSKAPGQLTNAIFQVVPINKANPADTTCALCPVINGFRSYASIYRGTYNGLYVNATGRYHSAYGQDVYQMNRRLTFNLGVRYEDQRTGGTLFSYNFGPSWSPRMGVNIDPTGDGKSKIFFNFGRNYWAVPLDAAIRQLGNEQDDTAYIFAPTVAADGTISVTPDQAHTLNGTPKSTTGGVVSNFGAPSFSSSTGEGIIPGTKQEYEDEYVIGFEREISRSMVFKGRYTDRRLGRIIEDIGSQSPEGAVIIPNYNGGIANPGPSTDIAVNEQEVTYTPAQFNAANGAALQSPGGLTSANYKAPVTGCTYANDTYPSGIGAFFVNGASQPVGGACFLNLNTADAAPGDGIPDGFVKPIRRYNAVEFELDKRFANHWLATVNFKWGNLYGNYEGAYRNDNGQSDPGISSLFDFTPGKLGLLGDQFTPGPLSTDRRTIGNLFVSYNVGSDTRFVSKMRGLTVGMGMRGQSGIPLSYLGDHPIYLNQGEVPIGGRGAAGRSPASTQLDMHLDYPIRLGEKFNLKLAMDTFNVTNSQFELSRVQFTQLASPAPGATPPLDTDYGRPTAFQGPFYARGSVRFEF
jgi:outer membrane receptor protein involved in Fe transport